MNEQVREYLIVAREENSTVFYRELVKDNRIQSLFSLYIFIGNLINQFSSERSLLLFGMEKNAAFVERQLKLQHRESKERSLVITVVQSGDARIMKYSINPDEFTIILIGKDN